MQTVTLELPEESAERINNLSKIEREELSFQIDNWLMSKKSDKPSTGLEAFHNLQDHISSLNLTDKEKEEWVKESMT